MVAVRPALFTVLMAALFLAPTARATWSVLIVDTATGEVALGQATCLRGFDLQYRLAVVLPGIGGGCVQSSFDIRSSRREVIWDGLLAGKSPADILADLGALGDEAFQFGIVDLQGRAGTHTGNQAGAWAGGLTGQSGTLAWAIQGNVLAGAEVVQEAENAILSTPGDLAEKLMAAMLAAAYTGGDGRCSCSQSDADSCGAPPPGFDPDQGDKSAHIGFMIVSRYGERRGRCNKSIGCANGGEYYLNFNITPGDSNPPDPILEMLGLFQQWRQDLLGRPDHLLTVKAFGDDSLPGNGNSTTRLDVELYDYSGARIHHGGHSLRMRHEGTSANLSAIGDFVDHGDGTYHVDVTAGAGQGTDLFRVFADDGIGEITLYPSPSLELRPTLTASGNSLSASTGGSVQFDLEGPEQAGDPAPRDYLLLGSISGTEPGLDFRGAHLPLNWDLFLLNSFLYKNGPNFQNTDGTLAADGRGQAAFAVPPGALAALVGFEMSFAYLCDDRFDFGSNPVTVAITP